MRTLENFVANLNLREPIGYRLLNIAPLGTNPYHTWGWKPEFYHRKESIQRRINDNFSSDERNRPEYWVVEEVYEDTKISKWMD
jgi:hypothetical protein